MRVRPDQLAGTDLSPAHRGGRQRHLPQPKPRSVPRPRPLPKPGTRR
ncbi:hypothetical protein [Streptomyces luteolus]|uniref:Uncharacterized protein n=1 Tax=Streptomyces luteolus TaxID=3043615 RepID=A0ABT6T752_9ACTN|nr:hypothetical protein [Streptomyces sp. B-S-A12]MDI3423716.1 hypothetical protein [Streptomyces sp. B-S-A12]